MKKIILTNNSENNNCLTSQPTKCHTQGWLAVRGGKFAQKF